MHFQSCPPCYDYYYYYYYSFFVSKFNRKLREDEAGMKTGVGGELAKTLIISFKLRWLSKKILWISLDNHSKLCFCFRRWHARSYWFLFNFPLGFRADIKKASIWIVLATYPSTYWTWNALLWVLKQELAKTGAALA